MSTAILLNFDSGKTFYCDSVVEGFCFQGSNSFLFGCVVSGCGTCVKWEDGLFICSCSLYLCVFSYSVLKLMDPHMRQN